MLLKNKEAILDLFVEKTNQHNVVRDLEKNSDLYDLFTNQFLKLKKKL